MTPSGWKYFQKWTCHQKDWVEHSRNYLLKRTLLLNTDDFFKFIKCLFMGSIVKVPELGLDHYLERRVMGRVRIRNYLISQKQTRNRRSIWHGTFGIQISFPFGHTQKWFPIRKIEHDDASAGIPIVDTSHPSEPLLSWRNIKQP